MLPTHTRYDYVPITARKSFSWPNRTQLAVYVGLNLEHFAFGEGLGAELAPGGPQPDVLNYAWRDYGNRVGAWRMLQMFEQLGWPLSVIANSEMYGYAPQLIEAFRRRGDEVVAHGRTNSERQNVLSEQDERKLIAESTQTFTEKEGSRPQGWLSPWIAESPVTPDLLVEAGYRYTLNWCMDDQPVWMRTRSGQILSIPYPQEVNDIPAIAARRESIESFADMIVDNFDEMLEQSQEQSLVMGIALHPYIVGQPFRLRRLRLALQHIGSHNDSIWLTTSGGISEFCYGLTEGTLA